MAKTKEVVRYRCGECGYLSLTLVGKCPSCDAWGSFVKEAPVSLAAKPQAAARPIAALDAEPPQRLSSHIEELDRVLGGGWVPGGVVLLGGEPGVGKSTLLLQSCAAIAQNTQKAQKRCRVLYISGEESAGQLALRMRRLGLEAPGLDLICGFDLPGALEAAEGYDFLVVDSVQAFRIGEESGWAGSPNQVRASAALVAETAKRAQIPAVLVGHITKAGQIAGPKLLEHLVDVVLLFSGEKTSLNRLLRAEKNRFGSTEELGIFEMTGAGLRPVADPSHLYWSAASEEVSGVALCATLEGTRPLMAEIQALACTTPFPYPKRTARGIEVNRLQLLLAVLEKRCFLSSRNADIYVNVTGGLGVTDPAADLAVCAAVASSIADVPLARSWCLIGEVGLAGEVRPVARVPVRLREAARLGFTRAFVSAAQDCGEAALDVVRVRSVSEALKRMGVIR